MIQSKIIYFALYTKLYFTATSKSTLNIYKFYKEVRKEVDHKDAPESKINTFDIQGVQEKLCFCTTYCNPFLAYIAVRDLQSSQRIASVQSLLLAGNFLYNK